MSSISKGNDCRSAQEAQIEAVILVAGDGGALKNSTVLGREIVGPNQKHFLDEKIIVASKALV